MSESPSDEQFKTLLKQIDKLEKNVEERLSNIGSAITAVAVQQSEIHQIQEEVKTLFDKYDGLAKPNGTISRILGHQAQCPGPVLAKNINGLSNDVDRRSGIFKWVMGGLGTSMLGLGAMLIKIMIDLNHLSLCVGAVIK